MRGSKTRIWHGGVAELPRTAPEVGSGVRQPEPAPTAAAETAEAPVTPSLIVPVVQTRVVSLRRPQIGGGTLVGHVFDLGAPMAERPAEPPLRKSSPLMTTRLVPIEELLNGGASPELSARAEGKQHAAPAELAQARTAQNAELTPGIRKLRLTGSQLRRTLMVVLGLASAWLFAQGGRETATVPAPPKRAEKVAAGQVASSGSRAEAAPLQADGEPESMRAATRAATPTAEPRAAVDALVAGDFVAAQRMYAELAQAAEPGAPPVYAEAARILAQRIREARR